MHIYNTLSGKKETFKKPLRRNINLFVCGPTVYDDAHIGHARTQITFDTIVRYLRSEKWNITYLQNITDIDDKIIAQAKKKKQNPKTLAKHFEKRYYEDLKKLNITSIDTFARATDHIPQIVKQVTTLLKKEYAYEIPKEGIYYNIKKFKDYGKLAKRTATQAEDGVSRIDEGIGKKNKGDFALWKFTNKNEPAWETKLGSGRPGWHIEDTAISEHYFGPQYDLHGGGLDLKFPHHEAEIAQQEAASGKKPFVKIWMHAGLFRIGGKKMSKSLGNFLTIRDFLKKHSANTLRWIALTHHYRSPAHYSEELARDAERSLQALGEITTKLKFIERKSTSREKEKAAEIKNAEKAFHAAMEDDFNTPKAIAEIFSLITRTNTRIWKLSKDEAKKIRASIEKQLTLLGIILPTQKTPKNIQELIKKRELSRESKQFVQADTLRKRIERLGYMVEDTPLGPISYERKNTTKTSSTRSRS